MMLHLLQMAADARSAAEPHAITYVDFLTVTLTAVCALLAALAIIIALAAIWGYAGIRDEISKTVSMRAGEQLEKKLSEYPDSKDIIALFEAMQAMHDRQLLLSSKLVSPSASESAARSSKRVQQRTKTSESLAKDYPGKGK
jgi:hypothetical protein